MTNTRIIIYNRSHRDTHTSPKNKIYPAMAMPVVPNRARYCVYNNIFLYRSNIWTIKYRADECDDIIGAVGDCPKCIHEILMFRHYCNKAQYGWFKHALTCVNSHCALFWLGSIFVISQTTHNMRPHATTIN